MRCHDAPWRQEADRLPHVAAVATPSVCRQHESFMLPRRLPRADTRLLAVRVVTSRRVMLKDASVDTQHVSGLFATII